MMTDSLFCPLCDSRSLTVELHDHTERRRDGATLAYSAPVTVCAACGEAFATPDQARAGDIARADALRALEHALTPESIKALRGTLGLTQSQFERFLGTGQKTVVRWETGTVVPSRTADLLLRVLVAVPEARAFCSQYTGVAVNASAITVLEPVFGSLGWPVVPNVIPAFGGVGVAFTYLDPGGTAKGPLVVRETGPPGTEVAVLMETAQGTRVDSDLGDLWRRAGTGEFRSPSIPLRAIA